MAELSMAISIPMPGDLDENDAELATAIANEFVRIVNEERARNNYNKAPAALIGTARWIATDGDPQYVPRDYDAEPPTDAELAEWKRLRDRGLSEYEANDTIWPNRKAAI